MSKASERQWRGVMVALTYLQRDGQQLLKSETNGNYFLWINGYNDPLLLSMADCAGWLDVHGLPQRDDTKAYQAALLEFAENEKSNTFTPYPFRPRQDVSRP